MPTPEQRAENAAERAAIAAIRAGEDAAVGDDLNATISEAERRGAAAARAEERARDAERAVNDGNNPRTAQGQGLMTVQQGRILAEAIRDNAREDKEFREQVVKALQVARRELLALRRVARLRGDAQDTTHHALVAGQGQLTALLVAGAGALKGWIEAINIDEVPVNRNLLAISKSIDGAILGIVGTGGQLAPMWGALATLLSTAFAYMSYTNPFTADNAGGGSGGLIPSNPNWGIT